MVGMPSRRSGSGRKALSEVREWSLDPHGGLRVVGRPFRKFQEWSGGPPVGQGIVWGTPTGSGVVGMPSRRSGSGREALPKFQ